jgi:2-(1,2-epoxy-1,2-dihydrophenyl)acetyl-CoA isomerase
MNAAINRLAVMPKPLITLVDGPAAGAGLGLALLGDVVIAAENAHFTSAYTAIGAIPDAGMSWLLPRLVGLRTAQELIFTNRRARAEEARSLGLITKLASAADLAAAGQRAARQLADGVTSAAVASRRLLLRSQSSTLPDHLEMEAPGLAACAAMPEAQDRIKDFLLKTS